jgi:hypothetical protein
MAQHDYNLANQSGADFRADLNNALAAIATVNSGATEPSTTFAHQLWVDTANSVLKIRNAANNAWITFGVSISSSNVFTGNLTGDVTGNLTGNVTGNVTGDLTGNADTATTLETARTISLSGDVVGSVSFDGSANVDISTVVQINSIVLGTDTTGDYVESISGGTGVTITGGTGESSTPVVAIGQAVAVTSDVTFNTVTASNQFIGDIKGAVRFAAKADGALSKGDVVYISGVSGNSPTVAQAKADDASKMPAFGFASADANDNASVEVITFGTISGLDTSNVSVGQILYVSTTAGAYTTTAPTGESSQIQNIGKVQRSHASAGSIKAGGAGRSNATPNLDNGKIFIGNGSNQSATSTLDTSIVPENTNLYWTTARGESMFDTRLATKDTGDLAEGSNLYYTTARVNSDFDTRLATKSTTNLAEGTNLYYTDARFDTRLATKDTDDLTEGSNLYYTQARFDSAFGNKTTNDLTENTNLYYTDTRANSAIDSRVTKTFVDNLGVVAGSVQADSVALGTDTTGNYIQTITGTANKITVTGSGSESADVTLTLPDDVQIADSLTVAGNLTVNGTLTSLDTTNLDIEDNLFQLNAGLTGSPVNDSGMLINRGTADNGIFMWDESVDKFTLGLTTADGTSTGNITLNSLGTLVANIEGNITGDLTGTIQTAAQPNITSVGTLIGLTTTGDINFGDDDKAIFGAGSDLQIYHNGTNSYIDEPYGGALQIRSSNLYIQKYTSENMISAIGDGAVTLYYDGVAKLATTSTGIDVTGTATMDGLTVDVTDKIDFGGGSTEYASSPIAGIVGFTSRGSVELFTDSNNNGASTGTAFAIYDGAEYGGSTKNLFTITKGNDISFYDDTGSTQALFWDASAERLGIGTTSPTSKLHVFGGSSGTDVDVAAFKSNTGAFAIKCSNLAAANPTWTLRTFSAEPLAFGQGTSESARFDGSGNFGIGTTSPTKTLHVYHATTNRPALVESGDADALIEFKDNSTSNAPAVGATGDNLIIQTGSSATERVRIDSSGNVGIGATSMDSNLHIIDGTTQVNIEATTGDATLKLESTGNNYWNIFNDQSDARKLKFEDNGNGVALTIQRDGKVGIGTSSPDAKLDISVAKSATRPTLGAGTQLLIESTANTGAFTAMSILGGNSSGASQINLGDVNDENVGQIGYYHADNSMRFVVNANERARIDSSGNVGIGTTSPSSALHVSAGDGSAELTLARTGTYASSWSLKPFNADFFIRESGTDRVTFKAGGNVGIGTTSPARQVHLHDASGDNNLHITNSTTGATATDGFSLVSQSSTNDVLFNQREVANMRFFTSGSERMRIDSSGNVLVGTTSVDVANQTGTTQGVRIAGADNIQAASTGVAAYFNKLSTDGDIVEFRKSGTAVGSIGTNGGRLNIGSDDTHIFFDSGDSPSIRPHNGSSATDGVIDIGESGTRFKDLHLSGTASIGNLTIGTDQGTDGQVLTSTGSGIAWEDASGGVAGIVSSADATAITIDSAENVEFANNIRFTNDKFIYSYNGGTSGQVRAGLKYDGTNQEISVYTNQIERMMIASDGSVGIGTSTIDNSAKLHIEDSTYPVINLDRSGTLGDGYGTGFINFQNDGDIYGRIGVWVEDYSDTDGQIEFQTQKGTLLTTKMTITSDGSVGIGKTPNRSRKLEVAGDINLDNGYGLEWEDGGVSIVGSGATDVMTFATAGAERMRIDSSGNVIIGGSSSIGGARFTVDQNSGASIIGADAASASGGYIQLLNNGTAKGLLGFGSNAGASSINSVALRSQTGDLEFQTNGANERMRITSAGALVLQEGNPIYTDTLRNDSHDVGTSDTTILDFSTAGAVGAARGFYLVTIVRAGASVGTHGVYLVGLSASTSVILYETLRAASGVVASTSGANFQVRKSGTTVAMHATAVPIGLTGN